MNVSPEFAKQMVVMAEAYGIQLTEQRIRIYYAELKDIPIDMLRSAMSSARKECRFFPTIAEIRHHALPTVDERAMIAWSAFDRAASAVGSWRPLIVQDWAAGEALVAVFGSWPAYCEADRITITARRQEFITAYRNHRRMVSHGQRSVLHGLLGIPEQGSAGEIAIDGAVNIIGAWEARSALNGDERERLSLPEARKALQGKTTPERARDHDKG